MAKHDPQNLIQNWMEQQQKLWQEWGEHVQRMTGGGAGQPWAQGLGQWRKAVEDTLETQKRATRAWADQVAAVEGAPEEIGRLAAEGVKLLDQWTDAQQAMWRQWFDLMDRAGASQGGDELQRMMSGWEQMAAQMREFEGQWARAFSGMTGAVKPERSGKSG